MGRYLGPRTKIDRKFHFQVFGFSKAYQSRPSVKKKTKRRSKVSEYGFLLGTKKFIMYLYNIRERQLSRYVEISTKKKENTEDVLVRILESRLDNVVYRLGFGKTRRACRQLVSHGHVTVNGNVVNIASYIVKVGDIICFKESSAKNNNIYHEVVPVSTFSWLKWDSDKKCGEIISTPEVKDVPEKVNFTGVIEFYSR